MSKALAAALAASAQSRLITASSTEALIQDTLKRMGFAVRKVQKTAAPGEVFTCSLRALRPGSVKRIVEKVKKAGGTAFYNQQLGFAALGVGVPEGKTALSISVIEDMDALLVRADYHLDKDTKGLINLDDVQW